MTYKIALVEAADLPTITTIQWSALRGNPLTQTLYPRGPTSELAKFTTASYERARAYPSVRILKAVDDETGQIVAFAKWIIYENNGRRYEQQDIRDEASTELPEVAEWNKEPKVQLPPHCYTRALNDWNNSIARMRKGIIGRRKHSCLFSSKHSLSCYFACYSMNLYVLDILHTHPSQQGKGAGGCLVNWGIVEADKGGAQCYVETPVAGYSLFRRSGFQNVTEMSLDLGGYKDGLTKYKHIVMVRPCYGSIQPERPPSVPPKDHKQVGMVIDEEDFGLDASEVDEEESPALQYTAEARMLDLRSSNSTGSPKLSSVSAMRASASTRDLRSSTTSSRHNSTFDIRLTSSMKDLRSSLTPPEGPVN